MIKIYSCIKSLGLFQRKTRYGLIFIATAVLIGAVCLKAALPDLTNIKNRLTITTYDRQKTKVYRTLCPWTTDFVMSKDLPRHVIGAIIVSEDSTFFKHKGIDWHEIKEAFKKNLKEKRYARGASTITQQVVKNAFLTKEKTLYRKIIEVITALKMERILSKQEILDYYINLIELGPGIYGIHDGALYYFKRKPKDLTPYQAALLAYFIPNPKKYGGSYLSNKYSKFRNERVKKIILEMTRQGYLEQ